ncbi:MAG: hypothetical protein BRC49_16975 [Cyanobacteria bacterium SW_10_48_33]|nr:MAG: hypothetical protein BRC45_09885 [Cyanobacteria bacterium QS_5_48_63]PSO90494.1 MAG: hypothetical protein BRC43_02505 [Cyanobacteria bacterium QS_3_48_167]PSO90979.1 MAG: hypothetical protein BRC46_12275 [Cyanobacteria bacterium QS_6_48_18]PSP08139.1 MAG: hypothetical protein BRC49_16975 [Cyanobacteria bacterium SW_10_48_33]PSP14904.1 MAG: hypothetical protein BRC52_17525 [Cyanobacteria bacterium SW_5_48_44]
MPNSLAQIGLLKLGITAAFWLVTTSGASAQTTLPNLLETTAPDNNNSEFSLDEFTENSQSLPLSPVKQSISAQERLRLDSALDELHAEAAAQLEAGNANQAFDTWYQELRWRQELGQLEEVRALGRVGEVAWQENRQADVQRIAQRLKSIQQEVIAEGNPSLLHALGKAYQQMRLPKQAIAVEQQILAQARNRGDLKAQEAALQTIAKQHLGWFHYQKAAATYEKLLELRSSSDSSSQTVYLQKLAEIYDKSAQPEKAVRIKRRLAENYRQRQSTKPLAALKTSLASDYETLNQPNAATQNYREAFELAWSQQQVATASKALQKLGDIYYRYRQPSFALRIYTELLKAEQQSGDSYGMMNTYDQMGHIYLEQNNYSEALQAFQKGQQIAQSLSYKEAYFTAQLERVHQQISQNN